MKSENQGLFATFVAWSRRVWTRPESQEKSFSKHQQRKRTASVYSALLKPSVVSALVNYALSCLIGHTASLEPPATADY